MSLLQVIGLQAEIDGKKVLKGIDIEVESGEVHALMGPNGAGKSSLANILLGHYRYQITAGQILLDGEDITYATTSEKAAKGLFLLQQEPPELPGVTVGDLLHAIKEKSLSYEDSFQGITDETKSYADYLGVNQALLTRGINVGASGGEKKRVESLQLAVLRPKFAILDELDSGLDVDALKKVATAVKGLVDGKDYQDLQSGADMTPDGPQRQIGVMIVTHYQRILEYLPADRVHILADGKIVASGDASLVGEIEKVGYKSWL